MSDALPDARWGDSPLPSWRRATAPDDPDPDDEAMAVTPPDVTAMLGFDPLDEPTGTSDVRADATADDPRETKQQVQYTDAGTEAEHCGKCAHFLRPDGCSQVAGAIVPAGWCKLFRQKAVGAVEGVRGAGMLIMDHGDDGDRVLFVRHAERGTWEFPGGTVESGESAEQAAVREVAEEIGAKPNGRISLLMRDRLTGVDYSTFIAHTTGPFEPASLSDELSDWQWASPATPPEPLHPGVRVALARLGMNELDLARAMASGTVSSPQQYENLWLFALRITGTGASFRPELNETVWRDPALYLNNDFLDRCNGLSVIWEHPPGEQMDQAEFEKRILGAILLPFIKGDEVWGIAKIYDQHAAGQMADLDLSTSPAVVFRDPSVNRSSKIEGGKTLLIEGKPSLLDHLAICGLGVWDKGGEPTGVARGEPIMAEGGAPSLEDRFDGFEKKFDAFLAKQDKRRSDDDDDAAKRRKDRARRRADAFNFTNRADGEDDAKCDARRDAEQSNLAEEYEEAGEEKGRAAEMASDRRKKADADDAQRRKDAAEAAETAAADKTRSDARGRADAHSFGKRGDDDDDAKHAARRDAEEKELAGHLEAAGEGKDDAAKHAHDRRVKADAEDTMDDSKRSDARADSALEGRLSALERARARSDEELDKLAEAQTEWDTVCQATGQRPTRPLDGEPLDTFNRRNAKRFQAHSVKWGKVDLVSLPPSVLNIAVPEIRADAMAAAYRGDPEGPDAVLREIRRPDRTGRIISEFVGPVSATLAPFRMPASRVKRINNQPGAF